jgi:hypothetical protein
MTYPSDVPESLFLEPPPKVIRPTLNHTIHIAAFASALTGVVAL